MALGAIDQACANLALMAALRGCLPLQEAGRASGAPTVYLIASRFMSFAQRWRMQLEGTTLYHTMPQGACEQAPLNEIDVPFLTRAQSRSGMLSFGCRQSDG